MTASLIFRHMPFPLYYRRRQLFVASICEGQPREPTVVAAHLWRRTGGLEFSSGREGCGTRQRSHAGFLDRVGSRPPMRAKQSQIRPRRRFVQAITGATKALHSPRSATSSVESRWHSSRLHQAKQRRPGKLADWSRVTQGQCRIPPAQSPVHVSQLPPRPELSAVFWPNQRYLENAFCLHTGILYDGYLVACVARDCLPTLPYD